LVNIELDVSVHISIGLAAHLTVVWHTICQQVVQIAPHWRRRAVARGVRAGIEVEERELRRLDCERRVRSRDEEFENEIVIEGVPDVACSGVGSAIEMRLKAVLLLSDSTVDRPPMRVARRRHHVDYRKSTGGKAVLEPVVRFPVVVNSKTRRGDRGGVDVDVHVQLAAVGRGRRVAVENTGGDGRIVHRGVERARRRVLRVVG
jgi:hypothetical protein